MHSPLSLRAGLLTQRAPCSHSHRAPHALFATAHNRAAPSLSPWRVRFTVRAVLLLQVWLFATAPLESLQALSKHFITRTCGNEEEIYEKGADADAMYFLVTGQVEAVEYKNGDAPVGDEAGAEDDGNAAAAAAIKEAGGDGGSGGEVVKKNYGQRLVYMAGEDFGVEGLLDNTFRWGMSAKVVSRKAVLLELSQVSLALPPPRTTTLLGTAVPSSLPLA